MEYVCVEDAPLGRLAQAWNYSNNMGSPDPASFADVQCQLVPVYTSLLHAMQPVMQSKQRLR